MLCQQRNKNLSVVFTVVLTVFAGIKSPFTLAMFAAFLAAIVAAISWRFHGDFKSPVVYTGDLKSHLKSQQKS